jgi:hypothetical protein
VTKPFVIPAGIKPAGGTSARERKAKSRQAALDGGGKQIAMHIPPAAVADLEHIKARDGLTSVEAVVAALHHHARRSL